MFHSPHTERYRAGQPTMISGVALTCVSEKTPRLPMEARAIWA